MKILVLFQYWNHSEAIDKLCSSLRAHGIEASSLNVVNWRFRSNNNMEKALWVRLLSFFMVIPKLRGLLTTLLRHRALLKLSENYSIIDIHFFSPFYDSVIEELRKRGKWIKVTIWGSDFYRVDAIRREQQRRIFQMIDVIQLETQQIANDFLSVYPEYKSKVRLAHFGIKQFEIIDGLLRNESAEWYRKELKLPEDKTILTCGTNGSEGHQHLKILESIEMLPSDLKEKLFLVFPMTYGGEVSYIEIVRRKAEALGLPYIIISSFLSLRELCKYRIASDIILTIQVSDALASAIQEHLYTEEILIAGDWLPYRILNEHEIFYLTTSLESLSQTLSETVKTSGSTKELCRGNRERLSKLSSWDSAIQDWIHIYNEIAG